MSAKDELKVRNRAEEALRESEERLRSLVEGSLQGIVIHRDLKGASENAIFQILTYNYSMGCDEEKSQKHDK